MQPYRKRATRVAYSRSASCDIPRTYRKSSDYFTNPFIKKKIAENIMVDYWHAYTCKFNYGDA